MSARTFEHTVDIPNIIQYHDDERQWQLVQQVILKIGHHYIADIVLTSPHSSITTLLVNLGRSFSFRSTTISYTDFVSLVPTDKRCIMLCRAGRNDRY